MRAFYLSGTRGAKHRPEPAFNRLLLDFEMDTVLLNRGGLLERMQADSRGLRQSFLVNTKHGLHARPCALLVKTLMPFRSEVLVEANGEEASGHSIMGLMALAAGFGCRITFTITGEDAAEAMEVVRSLFATHFVDAYTSPAKPESPKTL
jgi:phosphocarrier protein HPr